MFLSVGSTGFMIKKGYVEECAIQEVHDDFYTVKSAYYTFSVAKKDLYATLEAAEEALKRIQDKKLHHYLTIMENKEDFIMFCIQKAYHEAHNPEDYDKELIIALQQKYKEFFGKELE